MHAVLTWHGRFRLSVVQRYVKCPLELQALQLEIVISEDTERETQRQALKVRSCAGITGHCRTPCFLQDHAARGSTGSLSIAGTSSRGVGCAAAAPGLHDAPSAAVAQQCAAAGAHHPAATEQH